MEGDRAYQEVIGQLPSSLRAILEKLSIEEQGEISELRLFQDHPIVFMKRGKCFFLSCGRLSTCPDHQRILTAQQIHQCFLAACQESVHTAQEELCQGFVTMKGGHRVGICGTAVARQGRQVGVRDITSLNIRISRDYIGCAMEVAKLLRQRLEPNCGLLLAGAPASGKTTVLRDLVRILAGGDENDCKVVAVIDEREELSGGCHDLGITSHVLKGFPKDKGLFQALRTLAPHYIVCDELGTQQEAELLSAALKSGTGFIGTVHGTEWASLKRKPQLQPLLRHDALDQVVFLAGSDQPGQIDHVVNIKEGTKKNEGLGMQSGAFVRLSVGMEPPADPSANSPTMGAVW